VGDVDEVGAGALAVLGAALTEQATGLAVPGLALILKRVSTQMIE